VFYGIGLVAHVAMSAVERNPDKARANLEQVVSLVQTGLSEMRALILELRPELLASEGLVASLSKQATALEQRRGVCVVFDLVEEPDLSLEAKEALYRIAMEAMSNAARHAHARRIELRLTCDAAGVTFTVADDGIGFDPTAPYPGHLGLRSMRERAAKLGATLNVQSEVGNGSRISLQLPWPTHPVAR
jgi:signal transduction histidine kinase